MAKEEDESLIAGFRVSKNTALILALVILVVILLAAFLAFRMMTAQPQTPPVNVGGLPTPAPSLPPGTNATPVSYGGANYSVSPLVSEYSVSSTPQLVINCNNIRVGTFASKEQSGEVPPGTERQDLINSLCSITGRQAFCAKRAEAYAAGTVLPVNKPACQGANGKARLYAFQSPSCGKSSDQRTILDELAAEFPGDIELIYVCTPVFANDDVLCPRELASGQYGE